MEAVNRALLSQRHIQDHDAAATLEPHWGYADRVLPCTNDPLTCEYLDVVYTSHDVGMIFTGVFWATIGGILLIWAIARRLLRPLSEEASAGEQSHQGSTESQTQPIVSTLTRLRLSLWSHINRYLLPDCFRPIFGRTTRLQVVVLAVLAAYLSVFSFAGITYGKWITPARDNPDVYSTRTSLGPWANRVGMFAFALTPLSVLLSTRESLLSVLTGIPYQNFNFLHRWLGYIILGQSSLHAIGWCVIQIRLYQPQPDVAQAWVSQLYMIWGLVALTLLLVLFILTLPPVIRFTGYEFFRKSHYVLAMVYIGACIGHWKQLQCFLIPGLLLWFFDRAARAIRTFMIHYTFTDGSSTKKGLVAAQASITTFPDSSEGDVVRLDFEHPHEAWHVGQHFYLCFSESSIFQSHPFTPVNAPQTVNGRTKHSYVFRARKGETKKIAELAARKIAAASEGNGRTEQTAPTTPVILTGPYGDPIMRNVTPDVNILCVAGGTGVTYVLPVLLSLKAQQLSSRIVELVWVVRHTRDTHWIQSELDALLEVGVTVRVFATRDDPSSSSDFDRATEKDYELEKQPSLSVQRTRGARDENGGRLFGASTHPDLKLILDEFQESTSAGRTMVFASGPGGLMTDARLAVSACNSGRKVWKGEDKYSVDFVHDERMER